MATSQERTILNRESPELSQEGASTQKETHQKPWNWNHEPRWEAESRAVIWRLYISSSCKPWMHRRYLAFINWFGTNLNTTCVQSSLDWEQRWFGAQSEANTLDRSFPTPYFPWCGSSCSACVNRRSDSNELHQIPLSRSGSRSAAVNSSAPLLCFLGEGQPFTQMEQRLD